MPPSKKSKQLYLDVGKAIDAECDPKNIKYEDHLSKEEVLAQTPMAFLEEGVAVFLFVFGVPGAAYSVCCIVLTDSDQVLLTYLYSE